jgi:cobalamin biosynthesis Mg chelatase CobN
MEERNEAQEYAKRIAADIDTIDALAEVLEALEERGYSVDGIDRRLVAAAARDQYPSDADSIVAMFDDYRHELTDCSEVASAWVEGQLEVKLVGEMSLVDNPEKWRTEGVEVLVTYGGPNCWAKWNGGDRIEVSAYWGGEQGRAVAYSSRLAAELDALVEAYV